MDRVLKIDISHAREALTCETRYEMRITNQYQQRARSLESKCHYRIPGDKALESKHSYRIIGEHTKSLYQQIA